MKTLFRFFVVFINVEKTLDICELMFYNIEKEQMFLMTLAVYHSLFFSSYCKQRIRHSYKLDSIGMGQDTRKGDASG